MTHDELVKFAAWKLGVELSDPHFNTGWDLSSPDLMLKGMGVAIKEGMEPFFERDRVGFLDTHDQYGGVLLDKKVEEINKTPERFWQCWAEVEGGQG